MTTGGRGSTLIFLGCISILFFSLVCSAYHQPSYRLQPRSLKLRRAGPPPANPNNPHTDANERGRSRTPTPLARSPTPNNSLQVHGSGSGSGRSRSSSPDGHGGDLSHEGSRSPSPDRTSHKYLALKELHQELIKEYDEMCASGATVSYERNDAEDMRLEGALKDCGEAYQRATAQLEEKEKEHDASPATLYPFYQAQKEAKEKYKAAEEAAVKFHQKGHPKAKVCWQHWQPLFVAMTAKARRLEDEKAEKSRPETSLHKEYVDEMLKFLNHFDNKQDGCKEDEDLHLQSIRDIIPRHRESYGVPHNSVKKRKHA